MLKGRSHERIHNEIVTSRTFSRKDSVQERDNNEHAGVVGVDKEAGKSQESKRTLAKNVVQPEEISMSSEVKTNAVDAKLLFDINSHDNDKFAHALLYKIANKSENPDPNSGIIYPYKSQSKYDFSFVPLSDQLIPKRNEGSTVKCENISHLYEYVKSHGVPNFMGAHIQLSSQLNLKV